MGTAVSVIIPVYKVEKFISRTLDALIEQTFKDWEVICVNDGSPDSSREIILEYVRRDSRIRLIDKSNGGVSSARNRGVEEAVGEYVLFLDSDDFIHPQTLEIAVALGRKNGSDMVTWYKDSSYRIKAILRYKMGMDTIDYRPQGFSKVYNLDAVDSFTTDSLFEHLSESPVMPIAYPVKHFYIWRMIVKRSLIQDILFDTAISFGEEFPWWSALLLKNPRVTITSLPLYYYYPNFGSLEFSSTRVKKVYYWILGLEKSAAILSSCDNRYMKECWVRECKWPVIRIHISSKLGRLKTSGADISHITDRLSTLWDRGVFDDPVTSRDVKARETIARLIGR